MENFQEFYEDAKAEAAFQEILVEWAPFMAIPANAGTAPAEGASALIDAVTENGAIDSALEVAKKSWGVIKDGPVGIFSKGLETFGEWALAFFGAILQTVAATGSVFLGARVLGKAITWLTGKNKERLKKFNDDVDFEKNFEKEIKLAEIAEKGDNLSESEILRLKKTLADNLAKKYPRKEQKWWVELIENTGSFLKSKSGAGLAMLAFILI